MKLPRVRFTVRRLMVAVAVLAAILGAFIAGQRAERIRARRAHNLAIVRERVMLEQLRRGYIRRGTAGPSHRATADPPEPE